MNATARILRCHTCRSIAKVPQTQLRPRWPFPRSRQTRFSHRSAPLTTSSAHVAREEVIRYRPVEEAEPLERYRPGGFHPVQLGDTLSNGRYTIVHKLGFGGFSTIWLARDEQERRYVTLKICVASANEEPEELGILNLISSQPDSEPGKGLMHLLLDYFTIQGLNGKHKCFVTTVGRCSAAESKSCSDGAWLFPLETARAITAQLILALSFLHSLGVVHGDLHMGNVLLALPDISALTADDIYARYGAPKKETAFRLDGEPIPANVPPYVVRSAWLGKACEDVTLADAGILLTDFGESWQPSVESRYHLSTPKLYRAPEALFAAREGRPIGVPADVWALACVVYELFGIDALFECFAPDVDDVFAENVSLLGKPPARWWDVWDARGDFFSEDGKWHVKHNRISGDHYKPLGKRMAYIAQDRDGNMGDEELEDLEGLLEQMLRFLPQDRATASDLAKGRWMQRWGLPALECLERARGGRTR